MSDTDDRPGNDPGNELSEEGEAAVEDEPSEGYAWGFARQERELPQQEYLAHIRLLDEIGEEELEQLDLSRADDYTLWAAAQAFEELDRNEDTIALLKRIAASGSRHPALDYPDILLRLAEHLKERGDYDEATAMLDQVTALEPDLHGRCEERRAEILVLSGRVGEGLELFQAAARAFPDDPWVPLRAGWALLTSGRFQEVPRWIDMCERVLKEVDDEAEVRAVAGEIDHLRAESEARVRRRAHQAGADAAAEDADKEAGLGSLRQRILVSLDDEEARLTASPPRSDDARARATERLAALHARASRAWDDAVEAKDEDLVAAFDELQWDIVGLAERFGIELPGIEED